jgi:hypothetical protein|tara:strand:+ start:289 stop:486 length:198 start_codon:yes stop_codon:yes gene_type:complete
MTSSYDHEGRPILKLINQEHEVSSPQIRFGDALFEISRTLKELSEQAERAFVAWSDIAHGEIEDD